MTYEYGPQFRVFAGNLQRRAIALGSTLALCLMSACGVGSDAAPGELSGAGSSAGGAAAIPLGDSFELRPEWDAASCARASTVDVNLGNSAENFVRAAYCQVNGGPPGEDVVTEWAGKLRTVSYVRRIDVVLSLCKAAGRTCVLTYSDPWAKHSALDAPCTRSGSRDLGAVLMFFNDCPGGVNCAMDWANTHASGMSALSPLLAFPPATSGVYGPKNPGFWRRELLDAAYAGVQFFLLNVYGPDLSTSIDPLGQLGKALDDTGNVVKVGLFDDTSSWGRAGTGVFSVAPSFNDPERAAQTIFDAKWKPFFSRVPRAGWYLFNGRPLIYFYNFNNLEPFSNAPAVISGLRARFQAEFGVSPFVVVDSGYFRDGNNMDMVADGRFTWDTISRDPRSISENTLNGVQLDHFMVKWDQMGRNYRGQIAPSGVPPLGVVKDDSLLLQRLEEAKNSQITVIATWNDMGEGTGITRNYDYFFHGEWQEPDVFLKDLRAWQCSN